MKKLYKKIPKFANVPKLEHHSGCVCYCGAGPLMGELWQVIAKSKTPPAVVAQLLLSGRDFF